MTKWILIVLCLFLSLEASSQDKPLVSFEVEDIGKVKAGDTIEVRIGLNVLPGWFIYAPTEENSLQDVQMMSLRFLSVPNNLRMLGDVKMPDPQLHNGYEVFMDEGNVFFQRFVVNGSAAAGTYSLMAHLRYQACNNSTCYPPLTEKIEIAIEVEKPRSKERNMGTVGF